MTHSPRGTVLKTADLDRLRAENVPLPPPPAPAGGPGTELAALLAAAPFRWLGIAQTAGCGCRALTAQMDAWGPDGCAEHVEVIVDRLAENHAKLREAKRAAGDGSWTVPFSRLAAAAVVGEAIRRARAKGQFRHGGGGGG